MRPGLVETAVGAAILLAVAAPAPAGARPSGTGACKPLPSTRLGVYTRLHDTTWTLKFGACTFEVRRGTTFEGGGRYFVTAGNAQNGQIVLQNDRGCRASDQKDLPTPYRYTFTGTELRLRVDGIHGIADDACTGRGHDLTISVWIRAG